jgi:hypothetical protein
MACAELYFSSLCGLMQERKALHEALVAADGGLSECTRRLLGLDGTVDQLTLLDRWVLGCFRVRESRGNTGVGHARQFIAWLVGCRGNSTEFEKHESPSHLPTFPLSRACCVCRCRRAAAAAPRLSSNLKKEHVLRIMLNCFVWGRILTAVQFAKTAGRQGGAGREGVREESP